MDIRPITPDYAVSPQIEPADMAAIAAAGFRTVIDNRPDGEVQPYLQSAAMAAAAEAAGLAFVVNPVIPGQITTETVAAQRTAIAGSPGPVLAYCASGNRSSILWALSQAGRRPTEELIELPARAGYQIGHLRPTLESLAARG